MAARRRSLIMAAVLLMLVSCSSSKNDHANADADADSDKKKPLPAPTPICPQVAILRDLAEIHDYGRETPDPSQLVAEARILHIDGDCAYVHDGIDVKFDVSFIAAKGPRLGGLHTSFPYFAAVVDPEQNILGKELMTAEFGFASGKPTAEKAETLHVFIPISKAQRPMGPDYRVLLGFQIVKEENGPPTDK